MTRSVLLAHLLTMVRAGRHLSYEAIEAAVGHEDGWESTLHDLISLGIVGRENTTRGYPVFRIRGWRPIHVFSEAQAGQMSLAAQGVLTVGHEQRMRRMYQKWTEGAAWAEQQERRTA